MWSIMIYTPLMLYENPTDPFKGWSQTTCWCVLTGAIGGVLVALCIKHADSVLKTMATTGSIVLTTGLNAAFLHGPFTLPTSIGTLIVVVSVFNYNEQD